MCDKIAMPASLVYLKRLAPFLCLFFWIPPVFSSGEVYQWRDPRGVIHFTDNFYSVPEALKDSPRLIIREDLEVKGRFSEVSTPTQIARQKPILKPEAPSAVKLPEPEPVKAVPPIIDDSQHFTTTVVVVNSIVGRPKRKRCLIRAGCKPFFQPNFNDRRYIHPSVFSGGSRQYIHPESVQ